MSCSIANKEEIEEEIARLSGSGDMKIAPKLQDSLVRLPRGGILVKTLVGNIQFGMPPETVKDCMILQLDVPTYFVLPSKRFDFGVCLNVAEFEFPAYFNFFIRKKQVTLICDKESEKAIRTVFQETLLGPETFENFHEEFSEDMDIDAIPDIAKELKHFCKNPFKLTETLAVETLVNFINFDENGLAQLSEDVSIKKNDGTFSLIEKTKVLAILPDQVEIIIDDEEKEYQSNKKTEIDKLHELNIQDLRGGFKVDNLKPIHFIPPLLGVTILGNSHGFDPKGSTSGYIIWVNGRGVLVDPPPFATYRLKKLGIPDSLIEWVIISHCHGDHDAGAFQKILDTDKVEVITTPTIMGSFLRKYSAITGMGVQQVSSLFKFRPVTIGAPCFINGGKFKFFYSLHSIPAIGFEVSFKGKSIYFSADTFYYPEKMEEMVKNGVITEKRYHDLIDNKWNHDLILHEAGVPPIHTPISILSQLPTEIKEKIYLVHVSDIPKESGLKAAPVGIEKTIYLISEETESVDILSILDIVCSIEMFQHTPLRSLRDMIQSASVEHFKEGQLIFKEGEHSDKFFIIIKGITRIFCENPSFAFERFYQMGDYFGESVILKKDTKRTASVAAYTDVTLLSLRRIDFLFIFGANNQIMDKMSNLYESRQKYVLKAIRKNTILSTIASSQKIQFESICQSKEFQSQDIIWKRGDIPTFVMLIYKGSVQVTYDSKDFKEEEDNTDEFTSGTFVGETSAMLSLGTCKITVVAAVNTHVFIIPKKEYLSFLETNPKLLVNLAAREVIE